MSLFSPIQSFADWFTYTALQITKSSALGSAVNFFIFDVIKILILLSVIIFIVSIIRSFLPPEKIRYILARRNPYLSHILASVLGIITPFCSCSAIPLFLGFVQAGVPLGVTFSFLVASPMINEIALILLFGMFGWKIAAMYIISGLCISFFSGLVIGKIRAEKLLQPFVFENIGKDIPKAEAISWKQRMEYARDYTRDILKKVWPYLIVGIGVGAWIHGYIPTDFLVTYAGADKWYAVPLAVLIGIPLYSNTAGIIPLVSVLAEKGVAIGTTLAFMMAVTALSLPEFMILKKIMKTKLIIIFASIVGIGIIFIGYLFNFILGKI